MNYLVRASETGQPKKHWWDNKIPDKTKTVKGWLVLKLYGDPKGGEEYNIVAFDKKTDKHVGVFDIMTPQQFAHRMNWRKKVDWKYITVSNAFVEYNYQRKGVATAVYDWAEKLSSAEVVPYEYYDGGEQPMSEAAKEFWRKRIPGVEFYGDDEED